MLGISHILMSHAISILDQPLPSLCNAINSNLEEFSTCAHFFFAAPFPFVADTGAACPKSLICWNNRVLLGNPALHMAHLNFSSSLSTSAALAAFLARFWAALPSFLVVWG